jgi:hypothetical protein
MGMAEGRDFPENLEIRRSEGFRHRDEGGIRRLDAGIGVEDAGDEGREKYDHGLGSEADTDPENRQRYHAMGGWGG